MKKHTTDNCTVFQTAVEQCLVRHRSILDVMSKLQEANSRVNRAVTKAVTECGCVSIRATKPLLPSDCTFADMKKHLNSHLHGDLCDQCTEALESELGQVLFYTAAMCNSLGMELSAVMASETRRLAALGLYNLR